MNLDVDAVSERCSRGNTVPIHESHGQLMK